MAFEEKRKSRRELKRFATSKGGTAETIQYWRHNGVRFERSDPVEGIALVFCLHETELLTKSFGVPGHPEAIKFVLNTGGYSTKTTRRAMNEAFRALNMRFVICAHPGRNKIAENVCNLVPFNNEITIVIDGKETRFYSDAMEVYIQRTY